MGLVGIIDVNKQLAKRIFDPSNEYKKEKEHPFSDWCRELWGGGGGGGGQGGHNLPLQYPVLLPAVVFCPFVSRLRPFIVFLPLSDKSRCLTPYSNRECFGLVQNKKRCCKSNHFALSSAIIEAAFLRHKFTPRSKIFSVLRTTVVRSELPGRSSMEGFFPTTPKNPRQDKNGLWRHFNDILSDSLCCSYG